MPGMSIAQNIRTVCETKVVDLSCSAPAAPDTTICDDCLRELFEPSDRRLHHPFITCTSCSLRLATVQDSSPADVNAALPSLQVPQYLLSQPDACTSCSSRVPFPCSNNQEKSFIEQTRCGPAVQAARLLARGSILAVRGWGGYYLACDALNTDVVRSLRQQKCYDARPLVLMVPDLATARPLVHINRAEEALLTSRQRPIVLLNRREDSPVAPEVASSSDMLGIMLPYTPLYQLLLQTCAAESFCGRPVALVMTSSNLNEAPVVNRTDEARQRLHALAEGVLTHDLEIYTRAADSVVRVVARGMQFLRRKRTARQNRWPFPSV